MPRFLYGSVIVRSVLITAEDEKEALALLKNHKYEGSNKIKTQYALHWGEVPGSNISMERDGVLAEFLNLLQVVIPRSDMPEEKLEERRILILEEETKLCQFKIGDGICGHLKREHNSNFRHPFQSE